MFNFQKEFDFDIFKSLRSFKKRIDYCNMKLYKLGAGSSRAVYMIDPSTAIKVAKNEKGVAQNDVENDSELQKIGLFPEIYEADNDGNWLIVQLAEKAKLKDFEDILGVRFEFICAYIDYLRSLYTEYTDDWTGWKTLDYEQKFNEISFSDDYYGSIYEKLESYLSNFVIESVGDLKRIANWGVVNENGKRNLVIVDAGFNDDVAKTYYGGKRAKLIWESLNEEFDFGAFIVSAYEDYTIFDLFSEFEKDKKNGIEKRKWNVIPKEQYGNLLRRYMNAAEPEFARIPENIVDRWFRNIILTNTMTIEYITALAGHSGWFPVDDVNDYFQKDFSGYEDGCEFLDRIGFYDWCVLPDGSNAWSDYGLTPLYKIINEYDPRMEGWQILLLINRCLDVYHWRGDLASAFIEGGYKTCTEISSR